ncbi:MAG TPA: S1C family serine protease [Candidatus Blautia faecigallinarum]|uniref:S1C family serine protease n=1 Tax=Candidatus Blautia faecigallinarum TaxID=2838488 RepID=A0A9D2DTM9_9FIRM|nr:S1C family serine protease [Candidatus Blautia faecigallinarum]
MKDRRDNASGSENYHFIKETIKEKPSNTKSILKKAFCLAAGGAVLGCCAAFAFAAFLPAAVEWFGFPQEKRVDVDLSGTAEHSQSVPSVQNEESTPGTVSYETGSTSESGTDVLEEYEEIYSRVLEIAEEPMQALVHVTGVSGDENLLDHSFLHYGEEEGIVFLESDTDFYILTGYTDLKDADKIQVTFSNGAYALAEMCKGDARIGLSVVRVPKVRLSENTLEEISVAVLGTSASSYLGKPVIAIGSPMGEYDGVVYGMVTSVSEEISAADCAYSQMITDMQGSPESDGVLLDTSGSVIGIIRRSKEDDINMIKALPIAQIQPLLETLCNGEPIPYLGIHGITISSVQAENLGVSTGIYVDSAETDSPAMIAGIQTGDIITGLDGERVENMTEYSAKLHQMSGGENITVELLRRSASDGTYVEMEFDLIIEER